MDVDGKGRFLPKARPISYASHVDSCVFRHYTNLLTPLYEAKIQVTGLNDSVIAYRRFTPSRSNVDFAHESFKHIKAMRNCVVLAFDVRDFFEALDHRLLKNAWCATLGVNRLPPDQYAVFRAVTEYSFVNREDVLAKFGITKKQLKKWHGSFCDASDFRSKVRDCDLIKVHRRGHGVPQGSAMSGLLSNIYMLDVDREMNAYCAAADGFYRRYSDDILVVVPTAEKATEAGELLKKLVSSRQLSLHDGPSKSLISKCMPMPNGSFKLSKPIHYLGFTFDGSNVFIRHHTLRRFLRRMKKAVLREKHRAQKFADVKNVPMVIKKRQLFERYSHLGRRNFIRYAKHAFRVTGSVKIRRQMAMCWDTLNAELKRHSTS